MKEQKKISFPHMGNYYIAFKPIALLFGGEPLLPPPITKRTLEIGSVHSPESACVPFKYNLGNYIEALEKGANVLIQAGGGCRFGYYGEVQEEILRKLGYQFEFIKFDNSFLVIKEVINLKRRHESKHSYFKIIKTVITSYFKVRAIDAVENILRKNIGFEKNKGEHEALHGSFLKKLDKENSIRGVKKLKKKYLKKFNKIEINKSKDCLKVGIVGEFYVLLEPFSNFFIEKELGKKGVAIEKHTTFTSIIHDLFIHKIKIPFIILRKARPYLKRHIGAHGTESVAVAKELAKKGYDGIIHIKPFGCMPETNAVSPLIRVSEDYKIPIMFFSFDSQTSETGIKTRIEAFYDMLLMKKEKNNKK